MRAGFTSLTRRTRNYLGTIIWCLLLYARRERILLALAFAFGLAAPALQGFSVVMLSQISAQLLGQPSFSLPVIGPIWANIQPLWLAILLLVALMAASLSYYAGRWVLVTVGARNFAAWMEWLVEAKARLPDPRRPEASRLLLLDKGALLRGVRRRRQSKSRMLRQKSWRPWWPRFCWSTCSRS